MSRFIFCGVVVIAVLTACAQASESDGEACGEKEACHIGPAPVRTDSLMQQHIHTQIHTAIKTALDESAGTNLKVGNSSALSSLLHGSDVESLKVKVADDNRSASVSFVFAGRDWDYNLNAVSLFSADAQLTRVSDSGTEKLVLEPARSFKSQIRGSKASAILHKDGSATGLFEAGFQTLHVKPFDTMDTTQAMSLIAMAKAKHNPHRLQRFDMKGFFSQPMPSPFKPPSLLQESTTASPPNETGHMPMPNASTQKTIQNEMRDGTWTGTPWFPGCYPGDNVMNDFLMGAVVDVPAVEHMGEKEAVEEVQKTFLEASYPYEKQLNIALKIHFLKVYSSRSSAPAYAKSCPGQWQLPHTSGLENKYYAMKDGMSVLPDSGCVHLFTGCGTGYGAIGLAATGMCGAPPPEGGPTKCNSVNQIKAGNGWITMAHELGHNFDMAHSFEQGQGVTGGIMDYGDGKLNGEFQFNTRYRKAQSCEWITNHIQSCPPDCKKCKSGGGAGSSQVVNGQCTHYCSSGGYCGTSDAYKGWADCTECGKPPAEQIQCRGFFGPFSATASPGPAPLAGGGGGCPNTCYGETCDHWINSPDYMTLAISCSMLSADHSCDCAACSCPTLCRKTCFEETCDHWIDLYPTFEGAPLTHTVLQTRFSCDCSGCTR